MVLIGNWGYDLVFILVMRQSYMQALGADLVLRYNDIVPSPSSNERTPEEVENWDKNVETEVYLLLPPGCRIQEVQHLKPVETRSN